MSTSRGNINRKRAQKYQNRTAFKNDLHDTSQKTKLLNSLEVIGVCKRCKDIIEWKIKYKKYKPLSAPRKCVGCEQKTVKHAYYLLCIICATEKNACAKCCKPMEIEMPLEEQDNLDQQQSIKAMLKALPERKRRTLIRHMNKLQINQNKTTPESMAHLEEVLSKMDKFSVSTEDPFSDDDTNFSHSDDNDGE